MTADSIDRPYKCQVDIALPSNIYAQHLKDVLSVDGELGDKIVKSFSVESASADHIRPTKDGDHGIDDGDGVSDGGERRVLRM